MLNDKETSVNCKTGNPMKNKNLQSFIVGIKKRELKRAKKAKKGKGKN